MSIEFSRIRYFVISILEGCTNCRTCMLTENKAYGGRYQQVSRHNIMCSWSPAPAVKIRAVKMQDPDGNVCMCY
jgi:hypothetical protein